MNRIILAALACLVTCIAAFAGEENWLPIERDVKERVAAKEVTVVHFWAPWCVNCIAEERDGGWADFIAKNPRVRFVFIESWNDGKDSHEALAKHGIGSRENLTVLAHPGPRRGDGKMRHFMELPVTWLPTTWVFRDGRLRFAFNYGEIRFQVLQQLVKDSQADW